MSDLTTSDGSRRDRAAKALTRTGKWLAAILVASLILPALTAQWADRQNELALKEKLVSELTLSAATAIEEAHALVLEEVQPDPLPMQALRARYGAVAKAWSIAIFTLETKLSAYFPDAKLRSETRVAFRDAVHDYNLRVQDYIVLSGQICADNRLFEAALGRLTNYVGVTRPSTEQMKVEQSKDPPSCWRRTEDFRRAYQDPIGLSLLNKRDDLVETIIHADAAGYNVGFRDFLQQIVPLA
jgi:hypothetical protein